MPAMQAFMQSEATGGIILMVAALVAMLMANSGFSSAYFDFLHMKTGPVLSDKLGPMTVHLWINDGLMAIFFFLVGLEIKREFVDGRLVSWDQRRLPFIAALGGIIAPALIFLLVVRADGALARGWAIPAATDIAFAIGVLALLGSRVPTALKLFLMTVAIVDDMAAVLIIAVAYTASIKGVALLAGAGVFAAMMVANRVGVRHLGVYLVGFLLLWFAILLSGVHATIAGVVAAFAVPVVKSPAAPDSEDSPLHRLEYGLHPWVAYAIVPFFGFANAGVSLAGFGFDTLLSPLPLGIAAGLFVGKQLGIFGAVWSSVKLGIVQKPRGASWQQIYGVCVLCGIGFTMSLFIGLLAFADNPTLVEEAKIGVIAGSVASGLMGYLILRFSMSPEDSTNVESDISREVASNGDVRAL